MLLRRSIGIGEFRSLLNGDKIIGQYNLKNEHQNSFDKEGLYVCFFADDYWWIDNKAHSICVIVDIPTSRLKSGTGIYYASKNMSKTHIWSGRRGNELYELNEKYASFYSLDDVKSITLPNYTESALKVYKDKLKELNISIFERPDLVLNNKKLKTSLSIRFQQYRDMPKTELHESFKILLKRICKENGYTGKIEISCYDSSRWGFEKDRNIITRINVDLFNKDNKTCYSEITFSYSLETKKEILEKCKNNEEYDLSKINFTINPFGKVTIEGNLLTFENDFAKAFV